MIRKLSKWRGMDDVAIALQFTHHLLFPCTIRLYYTVRTLLINKGMNIKYDRSSSDVCT